VSLKQHMGELWQHRYGALIWWIAVRYIVIGFEYMLGLHQTMTYWLFGGISPFVIGGWMLVVGTAGLVSRRLCQDGWTPRAMRFTQFFAFGVCVHSFFRLAMLIQSHLFGDPLIVLFSCDLFAMFGVLVKIQRSLSR
jgi:hypothetical protein